MSKQNNPVVILIENIKIDQQLLSEKNEILEKAKSEKNEIVARMKEHRKDVVHMYKYMNDEQKLEVDDLLGGQANSERGELNYESKVSIEALRKAENGTLTNGELYSAYIDSMGDNEVIGYAKFNVKIRQIYNKGLISKEQIDSEKASRDDIITLHLDSSEK